MKPNGSEPKIEELTEQHMYHHNDNIPRVSVKVEKNTRGYNYEASVSNCTSPEEALELVQKIVASLRNVYGGGDQ